MLDDAARGRAGRLSEWRERAIKTLGEELCEAAQWKTMVRKIRDSFDFGKR